MAKALESQLSSGVGGLCVDCQAVGVVILGLLVQQGEIDGRCRMSCLGTC